LGGFGKKKRRRGITEIPAGVPAPFLKSRSREGARVGFIYDNCRPWKEFQTNLAVKNDARRRVSVFRNGKILLFGDE